VNTDIGIIDYDQPGLFRIERRLAELVLANGG